MGYPQQNVSTEVQSDSLMSDNAKLNDRLREILHRTCKLGDTLHGSAPRDANAGQGNVPSPAPTLRRYTDAAHATADEIESELTRIESRI